MVNLLRDLYRYYRHFMYEYRLAKRARRVLAPTVIENPERFSLVLVENVDPETTLTSLARQSRFPDEIIFVKTSGRDLPSLPFPITVIQAHGLSPNAARNLGIAAAQHAVVALAEATSISDRHLLEKLVDPLSGNPSISLSAPSLVPSPWHEWLEQPYALEEWPSPLATWQAIAFRKILWARVGGIPEDIPPFAGWEVFLARCLDREINWCQNEAKVALPSDSRLKFLWSLAEQEGRLGLFARWVWRQRPLFFGTFGLLTLFTCFLGMAGLITLAPALLVAILLMIWLTLWGLREQTSLFPLMAAGFSLFRMVAYGWGARQRVESLELLNNQFERRLRDIIASHPSSKGVILHLPTNDWHGMFQRPQQLARHFARAGYLFFYGTKNEVSDAVCDFQKVEERLYLVSMPAVPPETFRAIKSLILYLGAPWYAYMADFYEDALTIYDHYDDLQVSGGSIEDHNYLLQKADIVLASSKILMEKVQEVRPDVLFVPNGVDPAWINQFRPSPETSPPLDLLPFVESKQPIVGYSGALAEWLDYALLAQTAQSLPTFHFILIGIDYDGSLRKSGILDIPNVHWLGQKSYSDLFKYVWQFNVTIIPFLVNEITVATSPIKLYEYFACEKPVVSTPLPEVKQYGPVLIAEDPNGFNKGIKRALELAGSEQYRQAVLEIVSKNTWTERVEKVIRAISELQNHRCKDNA